MSAAATRHGWPLDQPVVLDQPVDHLAPAPPPGRDGEAPHRLADTLHPPRAVRRPPAVLDREGILAATADCLDQQGYDGTTIRQIAGRLGCAVGSIYRYFHDKRELLAAVCGRRLQPALDAAEAGDLDASVRRYLTAARARPELYRLMFWLAALRPEGAGTPLPEVIEALIDAWSRRLPPHRDARTLWIHLHGRAMLGLDIEVDSGTDADPLTSAGDEAVPDPDSVSDNAPRARSTSPESPVAEAPSPETSADPVDLTLL